MRALQADTQGYTSELLAKFAQQKQLDADLTDENIEQLIDYLVQEGLLEPDSLTYTGTARRGYVTPPGAGMQPGEPTPPYAFHDLLPYTAELHRAQGHYLASVAAYSQQMTMFQPVGGMDRLAYALAEAVGADKITYQAAVSEIRQDQNGVRIVYQDLAAGETREVTGAYCLSSIPLTLLPTLQLDFSPEMAAAILNVPYQMAGKIGLQFSRRFWEEDEQIFGGVTRTNVPTLGSIAYPSYGFMGQKGVLQACYNTGNAASQVSNLSNQERIEFALEYGSKIHPAYRETFENGFSVAWHRVPYHLGGWSTYTERTRQQYYPRLLEPDGRVYLIGEYLSYLGGWMEGSVRSVWVQMEKLHQRVRQAG